jgi:hypothetical protein
MDIVSPSIVAAAEDIDIRICHHHRAAVTSANVTHTSYQGRQQRNPQPHLDSVNCTVRFVHADRPFAEEIKRRCGSRSTAWRERIANRVTCSARPVPSTNVAGVIKS